MLEDGKSNKCVAEEIDYSLSNYRLSSPSFLSRVPAACPLTVDFVDAKSKLICCHRQSIYLLYLMFSVVRVSVSVSVSIVV